MKIKLLIIPLLALVFTLSVKAIPFIQTEIIQNGSEITLNWSLSNVTAGSKGVELYVLAYDNVRSAFTGIFLGQWDSTSGSIYGTIENGWLLPESVLGNGYTFGPNNHTQNIFSVGTHEIDAKYYDADSTLPYGYSPDGSYGGHGTWLESSCYIVPTGSTASVPESGSTALMLGCGLLVAAIAFGQNPKKRDASV